MSDDYSQFLNYFNQHLTQLKTCDSKADELIDESNKLVAKIAKNVEDAEQKLNELFGSFENALPKIDLNSIDSTEQKSQEVKAKTGIFNAKLNIDNESSDSALLRANVTKLNLLLEAGLKSKFFIVNRVPKVVEKFADDQDVSKLSAISKTATKIADSMTEEISKLNAKSALMLARDLEINNKMQAFDAILAELKKRLSFIA